MSITKAVTGKGEFIFLPVDKEAKNLRIVVDKMATWLLGFCTIEPLPAGNYQYLFTTLTASEKDAGRVVDAPDTFSYYHPLFTNYEHPKNWEATFTSALESLTSLLISLGLEPKLNYAILSLIK